MVKINKCVSNCFYDGVNIFTKMITLPFLLLHLLALCIAFLIIYSGLDSYFNYFTYNLTESKNFLIAYSATSYFVGYIVPLLVLFFYIILILVNKVNIKMHFLSLSIVVSIILVSVYKSFTSRISPTCNKENMDFSCYTNNFSTDSFTFDFLENGINWGFPSGHAASSVAFGLLFILLFWKKKLISFLGVLYIFAILLGISLRWHWLSDIIVGIFFGVLVALACHNIYLKTIDSKKYIL